MSVQVHVAKATYADDFDTGLMSLLVSHKSNNLREMNKLQSMVVRGFYNASDNTKLFGEIDPLGRAVTSIGLKLRKVCSDNTEASLRSLMR